MAYFMTPKSQKQIQLTIAIKGKGLELLDKLLEFDNAIQGTVKITIF